MTNWLGCRRNSSDWPAAALLARNALFVRIVSLICFVALVFGVDLQSEIGVATGLRNPRHVDANRIEPENRAAVVRPSAAVRRMAVDHKSHRDVGVMTDAGARSRGGEIRNTEHRRARAQAIAPSIHAQ